MTTPESPVWRTFICIISFLMIELKPAANPLQKLPRAVENLQELLDVLGISKKNILQICPHRLGSLDDPFPACLLCSHTLPSSHVHTQFSEGQKRNRTHISISSTAFILNPFMAAMLQGWILADS